MTKSAGVEYAPGTLGLIGGHVDSHDAEASVLEAKMSLGNVAASEQDQEKAAKYAEEQAEIKHEAEHKQKEARSNFHQHEVFARSVTMFQIAIAIAAWKTWSKPYAAQWMKSLLLVMPKARSYPSMTLTKWLRPAKVSLVRVWPCQWASVLRRAAGPTDGGGTSTMPCQPPPGPTPRL